MNKVISNKILVVDDEQCVKYLFDIFCEQYEIHFDWAKTALECLEYIATTRYKAIIMDFNLGTEVTGADLIKIIRQNDKEVKILANSGDEYNNEIMIQAGADWIIGMDSKLIKQEFERLFKEQSE